MGNRPRTLSFSGSPALAAFVSLVLQDKRRKVGDTNLTVLIKSLRAP